MYLILALLLIATPALAEEATPHVRALELRVNGEISSNIQCSIEVLTLRDKLKALEAAAKKETPSAR